MKTFVFDLDDTLLDRSKRIGTGTRCELMRRVHAGDHLILATSRPIRAVHHFLDPELMRFADIISLNGAIHHDTFGTVTQHSFLGESARILISYEAMHNNIHYYIEMRGEYFATNAVYTDQELELVHFATRDMLLPVESIDFSKVSKVALDGLGEVIERFTPYIQRLGLKSIPCLDGTFLNVISPGSDKSTTLQNLLDAGGINREDTIVFGDDIPDIEMMRLGGISVAVQNAKSEVKDIADFIIGDCDDDMIGEFIRNLFT